MIKKYKKKPVIIEACIWDGTNKEELISFSKGAVSFLQVQRSDGVVTHCYIKTLEGTMEADVGDYIICGVNGEFYPCKPDIFQKTYEEAKKLLAILIRLVKEVNIFLIPLRVRMNTLLCPMVFA